MMVTGAERLLGEVLLACDIWACGNVVLEVGLSAGAVPVAYVQVGGTGGVASRQVGDDGVELVAVGGDGPAALAALLRRAAEVLDARISARAVGGRVAGRG